MLVLGVTERLDIYEWLTSTGRDVAVTGGWYEERRQLQAALITAIIVSGPFITHLIFLRAGAIPTSSKLAIAGLSYLLCFTAIRAVSYHYVDTLLDFKWHFITVNIIMEYSGILCVTLAALWRQMRLRVSVPHDSRR